jgi:hypothetical protein
MYIRNINLISEILYVTDNKKYILAYILHLNIIANIIVNVVLVVSSNKHFIFLKRKGTK